MIDKHPSNDDDDDDDYESMDVILLLLSAVYALNPTLCIDVIHVDYVLITGLMQGTEFEIFTTPLAEVVLT